MLRRAPSLLAPLAVLGLLLAGCGGDDDADDADATTTEAEATTEADDEPATTDEAEGTTDGGDDADAPDGTEPTDDEGGGEAPEEFCTEFGELREIAATQDDTTLEGLRAGAATYVQGMEEVAQVAPEEIADVVDQLLAAAEELQTVADEAATLDEAINGAAGLYGDATLDEASAELNSYYEAGCPQPEDELPAPSSTETVPE